MSSSAAMRTYVNPSALDWRVSSTSSDTTPSDILAFHKTLPAYARTPITALPSIAKSLHIVSLHIKDESFRFGLPSFKILGASWSIHRAICARLNLPHNTTSWKDVSSAARDAGIAIVACSDGNWGRAVAHTAKLLQLPATIFVPENIDEQTQANIASEGATCRVSKGNYDDAIRRVIKEADETGALLVMDTSWPGFEDIPRWVTDGYATMLTETESAVPAPSLVIVSVGVGSFAHAVIAHYKSRSRQSGKNTTVVAVEPTAAASLIVALKSGEITTIETGDTIMCGMNCGTTSLIAWPLLKEGVDVSVTITDEESDQAVKELHACGVEAGPCGAAPLAALRKILKEHVVELDSSSSVVLFCTEGARPYSLAN